MVQLPIKYILLQNEFAQRVFIFKKIGVEEQWKSKLILANKAEEGKQNLVKKIISEFRLMFV